MLWTPTSHTNICSPARMGCFSGSVIIPANRNLIVFYLTEQETPVATARPLILEASEMQLGLQCAEAEDGVWDKGRKEALGHPHPPASTHQVTSVI